ncbi:hypothetical protein N0V87_004746 [Didymella glomerata]|uniref:Uncharacterized protein n=1 Tax=Didymella glomerata TaxID=749621 RepID=A0A9W8X033_9PLEO|nr:hypothetical protein N0V87_004746 [Didymella glomerata]
MHRRTLSLTTPPTNTVRGRFLILGGIITLVTLVYMFTPRSIIKNHVTGNYPYVRPSTPQIYTPTPEPPSLKPAPEKLIVKVQLEGEDLNWLLKLLPDWRNQVVTIDKSFASLHESGQRVDKGRIADAYLGWLITNYNRLPSTLIFIPPNLAKEEEDKGKWRLPYKSLVQSIQDLQIPHIQKEGHASLHCPTKQECEDTILPFRAPSDEYRTLEVKMAKAWEQMFNNTDVPKQLASPSGNAIVLGGVEDTIHPLRRTSLLAILQFPRLSHRKVEHRFTPRNTLSRDVMDSRTPGHRNQSPDHDKRDSTDSIRSPFRSQNEVRSSSTKKAGKQFEQCGRDAARKKYVDRY